MERSVAGMVPSVVLRAFAYAVPMVGVVLVGLSPVGLAVVGFLVVAVLQGLLYRSHAALARRARHDPLTGLPNREFLIERLRQALARSSEIGLIFLDLDDFKRVNDSYGHAVGDRVLAEVGGRLQRTAGPDAFVARYGGDEFAILVHGSREECLRETAEISQRIVTAVRHPVHGVDLTASVGTAHPKGQGVEELFEAADFAMYAAKAGRISIRTGVPNSETRPALA
jgi:diguanylate cyclase (GGDEF)-like protein